MRDSEALLLANVRYIDKGEFTEEILFSKSLESTTTTNVMYDKLKPTLMPITYQRKT